MNAVQKLAILLLLGLMAGQPVLASDDSTAHKAGKDAKKGGEAAERGIEKGAVAAGRGLRKGADATGKGLKKAGSWLEKKLHKL